jgi:hypothetical protein
LIEYEVFRLFNPYLSNLLLMDTLIFEMFGDIYG